MKTITLRLILVVAVFQLAPSSGFAGTHLDRALLPMGCATCHFRSNLRTGGGSDTCIVCHGKPSRLASPNRNFPDGFAPRGSKPQDIEAEFKKVYRHPTFDVRGVHSRNEKLPETDPRFPRHADCVDCHHPHFTNNGNRFAGIRGKRIGNIIDEITKEYELCYRCHGESANLPGRYSNKKAEFSVNNQSFHPVEGEGKNFAVVSLLRPYREKKLGSSDITVITCSDCHGSEDPKSPRGPHGSNYEHILVDRYSTQDNQAESDYAYALCYRCHSRTSILGNESFKYHGRHIQGASGIVPNGTSCHTCHTSHGSPEYRYLIRFNRDVVSPSSSGQLKFVERGTYKFSGECYLTCHGVNHNPKSY